MHNIIYVDTRNRDSRLHPVRYTSSKPNLEGVEFETMVVTPEGSIIRVDGGGKNKPETDPTWEARQAERKAKRVRTNSPEAEEEHKDKGSSSNMYTSPVGSVNDVVVDDEW